MANKEEEALFGADPQRLEELAKESLALRELVSQNPNAPAELLHTLAHSPDRSLHQSIVQNPNCPRELLVWLGSRCAEGFFRNPALPLLLLEDPNYFSYHSYETLCAYPEAPSYYLRIAAGCPRVEPRRAVAANPKCPLDVLVEMLSDEDDVVRTIAAKRLVQQGDLASLASSKHADVRQRLCMEPACPGALLETLAEDPSVEVRRAAAEHPNATLRALESLSSGKDDATRRAVAEHPNASAEILQRLSKDPLNTVRRAVAEHAATSSYVRATLTKDPDKDVSHAARRYPEGLCAPLQVRSLPRKSFSRQEIRFLRELLTPCAEEVCACKERWERPPLDQDATQRESLQQEIINCPRRDISPYRGEYYDDYDWWDSYEPPPPEERIDPALLYAPLRLSTHKAPRSRTARCRFRCQFL